jgi:hypothetical protein
MGGQRSWREDCRGCAGLIGRPGSTDARGEAPVLLCSRVSVFLAGRGHGAESGVRGLCSIPSHDTLGRVFAILDPVALAEAFREWMRAVAGLTQGGVVALDGKTLRRSFRERGGGFIHMVSAWSAQNRVVLAQVKTEEKSNEITAIPRLLELLQIREDHAGTAPVHLLQVVSVREERHG